MEAEEDSCGNCRFWKQVHESLGMCRRYAPRPTAPGLSNWSETTNDLWCGDHELMEAVAVNVAVPTAPLTRSDRREIAKQLADHHPEWSDRRIAKQAGVSPTTVGDIRRGVRSKEKKLPAPKYREPTNEDIGREVEVMWSDGGWSAGQLVCVIDDEVAEPFVVKLEKDRNEPSHYTWKQARILCSESEAEQS